MIDKVVTQTHTSTTHKRVNSVIEQTPLISYSIPCPDMSLIDFLKKGANSPRIYWETDKSPVQFAGFGVAARLTARGANRFRAIRLQVDQLFENIVVANHGDVPVAVGPRLFGGFSFNANEKPEGLWSAFPAASFVLPQVQLTHYNNQSWLTINRYLDLDLNCKDIKRSLRHEIDSLQAYLTANTEHNAQHLSDRQPNVVNMMSQEKWYQLVADATRRIRRGDLDKVVLARARQMSFDHPVEPTNVLTRLTDRYPDTYRFLFEPIPGHTFYGATPELLAEVEGSNLRTVAMAGSIRRGTTPEQDKALGQELMNNPKERHEHALVVDAIRENLQSRVSKLHIPEEPELCRLNNIQHLKAKIEGQLKENCGILPIIESLHPTPAVGGRSRQLALDIINNVEPTARGWYASPVGWIDYQGNGQFAVAIRSAVSVGNDSMLFAGAGIVAKSVPEKEWRETELKLKPLADALTGTFD